MPFYDNLSNVMSLSVEVLFTGVLIQENALKVMYDLDLRYVGFLEEKKKEK